MRTWWLSWICALRELDAYNHPNHSTNPFSRQPQLLAFTNPMIATTALVLWKLVAVFLIVIAVFDLLTMSQERRIRLYRHQGLSQRTIADRLGISRYAVRKALAH